MSTYLRSQDYLSVSRHKEGAEGVFAGHGANHLQSGSVTVGRTVRIPTTKCKSFFTECYKMNLIMRPLQDLLHLNWCYLFQTLTVSPEAERTARLSELNASVRASVRCPPSVRRAVLSATGVFCEVFRL